MSARVALGRWGWRIVRHEWRQQLLVLALITVATAAASLGVSIAHNAVPSPSDRFGSATHELGLFADQGFGIAESIEAAEAHFEALDVSYTTQGHRAGSTNDYTITDRGESTIFGGETFRLRSGKMPEVAGEAVVARGQATIRTNLGDRIEVAGHTFDVVGLGEDPSDLSHSVIVVAPGTVPDPTLAYLLVEATDDQLTRFSAVVDGFSFEILAEQDRQRLLSVAVAFGLSTVAMLEVVLLCAAGFAVIARRRIRQLGMLGALGASERHLRQAITLNGAAVGLVGGTLGVIAGFAASVAARPMVEDAVGHRIAALSVPWLLVAPLVMLAVFAAGAAAWWPARSMARQPITEALAARRPDSRPTRRSRWSGVAMTSLGAVALSFGVRQKYPNLVAAGLVVAVLGVLVLAPSLVAFVGRLARRLPLAPRIAARDIARHQSRSAVAIAALVVALAIPVAIAVTTTSGDARDASRPPNLPDNMAIIQRDGALFGGPISIEPVPAEVAASTQTIQAAVPDAQLVPVYVALSEHQPLVRGPGAPANSTEPVFVHYPSLDGDKNIWHGSSPWIATPDLLKAFDLPADLVSSDSAALTTTQISEFALFDVLANEGAPDLLAAEAIPLANHSSVAQFWLTSAAVDQHQLQTRIGGWLLITPQPINDEAKTALVRAAADNELKTTLQRDTANQRAIRRNAIAAGSILALTVLAIVVTLIRSEQAQDARTLAAVGAPARTRRLVSSATAGLLALTAALLAVPAGYLALLAVMSDPKAEFGFVVPVQAITAIAIGIPVLAATGAWLLCGREPKHLGRVPST